MESSTKPLNTLVEYRGTQYNVVKEGLAHILNPPAQEAASKGTKKDLKADDESQSVFYNPIQQFNRDLSVLAIRAYSEHAADLRRQRTEQKQKKRNSGNDVAKGKKRKREDDSDDPAPRPAVEGEIEKKPETSEQPISVSNGKQEAQPESAVPASFTVLDALSATGLRALRYASELPVVTKVVANDLSSSAIQSMKTNIDYNELNNRIQPNLGDARSYMYSLEGSVKRFDVIDLDPYGTAAPFVDAAVQAVKDGGLLCVTCTDAGVWASTGYAEKAFALYGGIPIKGYHSHEGGLRLILNSLAMSAAKYGMQIEPLLSLSIDFYARVFVRVSRSPVNVKFNASNTMVVYNCDSGCGAWTTQPIGAARQKPDRKGNPVYHYSLAQAPTASPNCEHCGFKTHLAGPMWAGPLHNPHFIQRILNMLPNLDPEVYQTIPRIEGMLTTAMEEDLDLTPSTTNAPTSDEPENAQLREQAANYPAIIPRMDPAIRDPHPFFCNLSSLSKVLHCSTVPIDEFRGALRSIGYRSTRSHAKPNSIRTDAPWSVIWEVMREWVRQHSPVKEGSLKPATAGAAIMAKSRDNLRKFDGEDPWLSQLKKDLLTAIESGRDVSDLVTKVEASLYRSGSRQVWKKPELSSDACAAELESGPQADSAAPTATSERPHPSTLEVKFDATLGRQASATHSKKRLVRYQINPRANWGPLNRAAANSK
ncbi:hypothetical protein N7462_001469 [Penicillium macrosclerotiorum]|uniref:uncharacterized protein n=1 Tax=Penicillium macrosclerotiorum TaxID=303699 RepID=UPI002546B000|nr:uncharacterized protein N7462_001469 [Penicillium macrosclerotiorum]KAJ5692046.1 hypothetical protein N7462_001469 [Penicillium macrosclerotiorum]